jgi:N utilization substance protein A
MDIAAESRRAVSELFGDSENYSEEISRISELPGVDARVAALFLENGVDFIEDFLALGNDELEGLKNISAEDIEGLRALIEEYVEIVEEGPQAPPEEEEAQAEGEEEGEEYTCPECGAKITVDMTTCPNCGVGLSFEYEDE